jgi:hypothetical protein
MTVLVMVRMAFGGGMGLVRSMGGDTCRRSCDGIGGSGGMFFIAMT